MWWDKLSRFLKRQGWEIKEKSLYEQALTHSSFAYEKGRPCFHNERLEFLGDAVLELIISSYLYKSYPALPEGKLTRLRADLVCEASLATLAENLNLGEYLRLGRGERASGGDRRPSLLADALEALIGAIYLDWGLKRCRRYVLELYRPALDNLQEGLLRRDYKTRVQELAQARFGITPEYRIIRESGPEHDKMFQAEIVFDLKSVGRGTGRTKKESEQAAAKKAWVKLTRDEDGRE